VLACAGALIPLAVAVGWAESFIGGRADVAATIASAVVLIAIPLAVGVAVMRYRLYEIDRIVNRTLVYATLSVLLAATYGLVSIGLGVALGSRSTLATAAATLTVALVFGRLRTRVQMIVDRRFNRARYEGLRQRRGAPRRPARRSRDVRADRRGSRRCSRRSDARARFRAARRGGLCRRDGAARGGPDRARRPRDARAAGRCPARRRLARSGAQRAP
jgi:ribosomal protein S13